MADVAGYELVRSYEDGTNFNGNDGYKITLEAGVAVRYKMRAQDSGVSLPGYVTWLATEPDFSGSGYALGVPTPVSAMVAGSAVVVSTILG